MTYALTQDQLDFWNTNGFLIIDDFIPSDHLAAFDTVVRRLVRFQLNKACADGKDMPEVTVGRELNDGINALEAIDHAYVSDVVDFLTFMPERLRMASRPEMGDVVRQLLGIDVDAPLYLSNSDVVFAQPGDTKYTYGWHKDDFYTIPESDFVLSWAPLVQDATSELGCLQVAPGSHVSGWRGQVDMGGTHRHRFQVSDSEMEKWEVLEAPMKLGSMLFFHPGLAHKSGFNSSDTSRVSLVGFYHKVENNKIRPLKSAVLFKGKTGEDYFREKYADV